MNDRREWKKKFLKKDWVTKFCRLQYNTGSTNVELIIYVHWRRVACVVYLLSNVQHMTGIVNLWRNTAFFYIRSAVISMVYKSNIWIYYSSYQANGELFKAQERERESGAKKIFFIIYADMFAIKRKTEVSFWYVI